MTEHEIEMDGLEFIVEGTYQQGFIGNREQPPEPKEFEIEKVILWETDVTELLENSYMMPNGKVNYTKLDELEQLILEEYYGE